MDICYLLKELGNDLGIHSLKLSDNGSCRLVFDEKIVVDIEADDLNENVRFYSVIAMLASELSISFYEKILSANLSGLSGGDNCFAIDMSARELVLFSNLDMELIDQTQFSKRLEVFVNDVEHWVNNYQRGALDDEVVEENTSDSVSHIGSEMQTSGLRL